MIRRRRARQRPGGEPAGDRALEVGSAVAGRERAPGSRAASASEQSSGRPRGALEAGAGRRGAARETPAGRGPAGTHDDAGLLEGLVRVVLALHRERTTALLGGLAGEPRRRALALLGNLQRKGRAERHAELTMAFAAQRGAAGPAEGIPGALGVRVRALVAPGSVAVEAALPPALERWARRLALECGASGQGDGAALQDS